MAQKIALKQLVFLFTCYLIVACIAGKYSRSRGARGSRAKTTAAATPSATPASIIGPEGPPGPPGEPGVDGVAGTDGADGPPGPPGPPGEDGEAGAAGADGENGADGPPGADSTVEGPAGPPGPPGDAGADGNDGNDGPPGEAGPPGPPGADGTDGINGVDGMDGTNGRDGFDGNDGPPGEAGPPGTGSGSSVYVRWGRTTCNDSTADLVYAGWVGGGRHDEEGGGTQYLCLPEDPLYGEVQDGAHDQRAYVYGGEYEMLSPPDGDTTLHDADVVCAVCLAPRAALFQMVAKAACPDGWTLEYSGWLMAEKHNHISSKQYVCVDEEPEGRAGSNANQNGALFYFTEGRCGSLPCPPYVDGHEFKCAICTI